LEEGSSASSLSASRLFATKPFYNYKPAQFKFSLLWSIYFFFNDKCLTGMALVWFNLSLPLFLTDEGFNPLAISQTCKQI